MTEQMKSGYKNIILRDMIASDIADYVQTA